MSDIVNKVANSGLITLDLEQIKPSGERVLIDIADQLVDGLILREKEFRAYVSSHNWDQYKGKHVAIICSVDAIVPTWAYMLISSALRDHTLTIVLGNLDELEKVVYRNAIETLDESIYVDQRIVIKGCGQGVPTTAYIDLMNKIRPIAKSIMYGEPCSTVPLYKKKRP
ncbi:MAG: DUF2480 family protein [Bacteroidia bacterium]|nr:DUF2480 family protein [Bacteroidia bacterium]